MSQAPLAKGMPAAAAARTPNYPFWGLTGSQLPKGMPGAAAARTPNLPLLEVDWVASGGFGLRGRRTRVNRVLGGDASPELCDQFLP